MDSNHRFSPRQGAVLAAERWDHEAFLFSRGSQNRAVLRTAANQELVPRPGIEPGTSRSKRGVMVRFTIGAKAEGKGVEPSCPCGRLFSGQSRRTVSGYLPYSQWRHEESNLLAHARGLQTRGDPTHQCLRLFHSGDDGNRTHRSLLARQSRRPWYMRPHIQ